MQAKIHIVNITHGQRNAPLPQRPCQVSAASPCRRCQSAYACPAYTDLPRVCIMVLMPARAA